MNAKLIARVALTVIFHGWVVSSAGAQGVGAIAGSVLDDAVLPLPGVTVTLSSAGVIGGDQEVLTDARGTYQFVRLVPGTYTVTARLVGFSTRVQEGIVVNADATARADLQLAIGALQETINGHRRGAGHRHAVDAAAAGDVARGDRRVAGAHRPLDDREARAGPGVQQARRGGIGILRPVVRDRARQSDVRERVHGRRHGSRPAAGHRRFRRGLLGRVHVRRGQLPSRQCARRAVTRRHPLQHDHQNGIEQFYRPGSAHRDRGIVCSPTTFHRRSAPSS